MRSRLRDWNSRMTWDSDDSSFLILCACYVLVDAQSKH